uniref:4-hydroxythreonine-4-phosphate dehydrogenase n=1 Tax=uncultured prokaryote TaxID=198431 RepID=H5SPA8_9ZZZZ|nr:4-hydroxythreonine-4-phosphate dehydrogenase [uncultured prokaryote]
MDKRSERKGNCFDKDVKRPLIAITMGDPTGVGPEIICKALAKETIRKRARICVIGDRSVMERVSSLFAPHLPINPVDKPEDASDPGSIHVLSLTAFPPEGIIYGRPTGLIGAGMFSYIRKAAELAMEGRIDAVVTAPINKKAITEAGFFTDSKRFVFTGHTEFFLNFAGSSEVAMMLAGRKLKVVPVTTHIALREVCNVLTKQRIISCIRLVHKGMKLFFGKERPRIAVSALNPHAGEGGIFGREEELIIIPAIEEARAEGIDVSGPYPPDTVYFHGSRGLFDVVIGMYHDQCLAPLKLLHFYDAVNITLGLPFIRTSVDHGTAYDIAGKGLADERSMVNAIKIAADAARRMKYAKGGN